MLLTLLSSAVLGFLTLNFPFGKFLGDGGAYALGHLLVWSSILLINYDSRIILSPFFNFLASCRHWTCNMRRWKLGNPPDRPDRLHFHQLAMRFLEIRFLAERNVIWLIPLPLLLAPLVAGPKFWESFFGINFTYLLLAQFA